MAKRTEVDGLRPAVVANETNTGLLKKAADGEQAKLAAQKAEQAKLKAEQDQLAVDTARLARQVLRSYEAALEELVTPATGPQPANG